MNKLEFLKNIEIFKKLRKDSLNNPNRLNYHLMAMGGWLNDPNGLCQFNGINHIYFQHSPFSLGWDNKIWGHYSSKDWINYEEHQPFIFSDILEDKDGAYSGSAIKKDGKIHYFYTGNHKFNDKKYNYDYEGRIQSVIKVTSNDGNTFESKKIILKEYPNFVSVHIRDPKVFLENGIYYMVLGAKNNEGKGIALIYKSKDLEEWDYHFKIESKSYFGYMWECPDLVKIQDKWFLFISPQGIPNQEFNFQNKYQVGYFNLDLDLENKTYQLKEFIEIDKGFDFYASQSFVDEKDRNILIAWMGMADFAYQDEVQGFNHCLTIPRELSVNKYGHLIQKPLVEFLNLREKEILDFKDLKNYNKSVEVILNDLDNELDLVINDELIIKYEMGIFYFEFKNKKTNRDIRKFKLDKLDSLHFYFDSSSVEIFINDGIYTISSRCYFKENYLFFLINNLEYNYKIFKLKNFNIIEFNYEQENNN